MSIEKRILTILHSMIGNRGNPRASFRLYCFEFDSIKRNAARVFNFNDDFNSVYVHCRYLQYKTAFTALSLEYELSEFSQSVDMNQWIHSIKTLTGFSVHLSFTTMYFEEVHFLHIKHFFTMKKYFLINGIYSSFLQSIDYLIHQDF